MFWYKVQNIHKGFVCTIHLFTELLFFLTKIKNTEKYKIVIYILQYYKRAQKFIEPMCLKFKLTTAVRFT